MDYSPAIDNCFLKIIQKLVSNYRKKFPIVFQHDIKTLINCVNQNKDTNAYYVRREFQKEDTVKNTIDWKSDERLTNVWIGILQLLDEYARRGSFLGPPSNRKLDLQENLPFTKSTSFTEAETKFKTTSSCGSYSEATLQHIDISRNANTLNMIQTKNQLQTIENNGTDIILAPQEVNARQSEEKENISSSSLSQIETLKTVEQNKHLPKYNLRSFSRLSSLKALADSVENLTKNIRTNQHKSETNMPTNEINQPKKNHKNSNKHLCSTDLEQQEFFPAKRAKNDFESKQNMQADESGNCTSEVATENELNTDDDLHIQITNVCSLTDSSINKFESSVSSRSDINTFERNIENTAISNSSSFSRKTHGNVTIEIRDGQIINIDNILENFESSTKNSEESNYEIDRFTSSQCKISNSFDEAIVFQFIFHYLVVFIHIQLSENIDTLILVNDNLRSKFPLIDVSQMLRVGCDLQLRFELLQIHFQYIRRKVFYHHNIVQAIRNNYNPDLIPQLTNLSEEGIGILSSLERFMTEHLRLNMLLTLFKCNYNRAFSFIPV